MTDFLSFLIEPMAAILEWIHATLGISWGWSIVVLTIFVRILLIPLGVKQYTSMRGMQKLQPKIKELQKKYKDDKQKLNEETMKFYKENKVNPFGSCLPLLLQMPLFIALYLMLKNHPFESDYAWLWISNINEPNTVLVFFYIGTQFLSSRLLSTATDKTQQMMMTVMPLFLGVIFLIYPFPAGVLIYWVTTNVWTIAQQLVTKRVIQYREDANGTAAATIAPAGGGNGKGDGKGGSGKKKGSARKGAGKKGAGKKGKAGAAGKKKKAAVSSGKSKTGGEKTGGKGNGKS